MRIINHEAPAQQTQVELTQGLMRAEVAKRTQPGGSFRVQTPTAVMGVVGRDFIVEAEIDVTVVYCLEGMVAVQNINPAISGQVTLHEGEYTYVARGLPPSAPMQTPHPVLQSQINQTNVGPPTATATATASKVPWHIGSLSEADSILLAAGIGAAAALAIPAITSGPASPSAP
jgi:hypothetical protein